MASGSGSSSDGSSGGSSSRSGGRGGGSSSSGGSGGSSSSNETATAAAATRRLPSTASPGTSDDVEFQHHLRRTRTLKQTERNLLQRRLSDGVREIFSTLGRSNADRINQAELLEGLEQLRLPCSKDIVKEIFAEADLNNDGYIDYAELLGFVKQRESEIAQAFGRLTPRARGSSAPTHDLSFADLKLALSELGVAASDRQIAAFMTYLDHDESGTVSLAEFTSFIYLLPRVDVAAAFETWLATTASSLDTGAEPGQSSGLLAEEPAGSAALRASDSAVFLSGAVSGVVSRTATAPLDRLKMLMQVSSRPPGSRPPDGGMTSYRPDGVISGLRGIHQRGGFFSFFQGNTANVIKVMPESGVKFWSYDAAKQLICADARHPRIHERLLAGACAGAASCIAIYPLEVAKTRLAVASAGTYRGVVHCMQETVRAEGPLALYKGLGASLVGIIPFSAVDLALYNTFKAELRRSQKKEPSTLTMLGCGALSSSLAQLATYPLALAKTRLQASGMPGYDPGYDGLLGCLRSTVKHEGVGGLYRGIVPNLLKAVPSISISYVVFENVKRELQSRGWSQRY